jgi:uncharacterized membrane protein YdjX (TVP38/TMEM64 family)
VANNNKNTQRKAAAPAALPVSRGQRVLGYMVASIVGLAIFSIAAVLIGYATSANNGTGVWQVVDLIPDIALPLALVLVIVLIAITATRRARAAKGADK